MLEKKRKQKYKQKILPVSHTAIQWQAIVHPAFNNLVLPFDKQ